MFGSQHVAKDSARRTRGLKHLGPFLEGLEAPNDEIDNASDMAVKDLTPAKLRELAAYMRTASSSSDGAVDEMALERWLVWLDKVANVLQEETSRDNQKRRHWVYRAEYLIRMVLISEVGFGMGPQTLGLGARCDVTLLGAVTVARAEHMTIPPIPHNNNGRK